MRGLSHCLAQQVVYHDLVLARGEGQHVEAQCECEWAHGLQRARARAAFLIVAALAGFSACRAGDPSTRQSFARLQFLKASIGAGSQTLVTVWLPEPFQHLTFRDAALTGRSQDGRLFDQPIVDTGNVLSVRYDRTPLDPLAWQGIGFSWPPSPGYVGWADQDEILLFARDPEEHYRTLAGIALGDGPSSVSQNLTLAQLRPAVLPQVATMVYPPTPSFTEGSFRTEQLHVADFWTVANPSGPGAYPSGTGSLKSARVVHHGICSREIPYVDVKDANGNVLEHGLLDLAADMSFDFYTDALAARGGTGSCATRYYTDVIPFLHETISRDESDGGFFFRPGWSAHLKDGTSDPAFDYNIAYAWRLLEGRLTVAPASIASGWKDGTGRTDLERTLNTVWTQSLDDPFLLTFADSQPATFAQAVFSVSDSQQLFYTFSSMVDPKDPYGHKAGKDNYTECTPVKSSVPPYTSLDTTLLPANLALDKTKNQCFAFIAQLENFAEAAAKIVLTPAPSAAEIDRMRRTVEEADVDGNLKNVRCAKRRDPATGDFLHMCEYIARAKRINTFPDAVELVWLDDDREVSNPIYPLWLLEQTSGSEQRALCKRQPVNQPSGFAPRAFTPALRGGPYQQCGPLCKQPPCYVSATGGCSLAPERSDGGPEWLLAAAVLLRLVRRRSS